MHNQNRVEKNYKYLKNEEKIYTFVTLVLDETVEIPVIYVLIGSREDHISMIASEGECGENLTWKLESGTLTISGTGAMTDYSSESPWRRRGVTEIITEIIIENGVTSIGEHAFGYCRSLANIEIPSSVTTIGNRAFDCCDNLTSVTFGENSQLTTIASTVFSGCSNLRSIEIPSSVTSIGARAFKGCENLNRVFYEGSEKQWRRNIGGSDVSDDIKIIYGTSKLTYNGTPQKPTVVIQDGDNTLVEDVDYEVSGAQTAVGTYTSTITGKGDYAGTIEEVRWSIEEAELTDVSIQQKDTLIYNSLSQTPQL